MGEETKQYSKLYYRKKENWFIELLIKFKIVKAKYKELEAIDEISMKGEA